MQKRSRKLALLAVLLVPCGLALGCHLWAQRHYRAAQSALQRRAFPEAQQHLAQCLRVWILSAQTHLLAARTARRAGTYDEASRHLQECYRLGGSPEVLYLEYGLLRAQQGELDAVEGYLVSHVFQNDPASGLILEVLSREYLKTFQLFKAQERLKQWLEREPEQVQAWLWRAQLFGLLRNSEEAGNSYRRIIELEPDNDDARLGLAALLIQGQNPHEALGHFEHLRARQGDSRAVLRGLASCRRALNQPEEACRLLDALLAKHPRDGGALTDRGRLALELESAAAAEQWFRQAVAVTPFEREAVYGLYQCLERLGKRQEAEQVLTRLKRIEEDLGRLNETTRAIAKVPHNPALRCEAGRLLLRNGQELEGLRWLESALGQDPNNPDTHQALADYYEGTGDAERTARHRELARQLSTGSLIAPGRPREPSGAGPAVPLGSRNLP